MQGTKNEIKRRRKYNSNPLFWQGWTYNCDFERQLRNLPVEVDIPDGGYYKKFFTHWEWN
jgi:hypothetical protein